MKHIILENAYIKISFCVDDNNNLYYEYFGNKNTNFLIENKDKTKSHLVEIETREENHNGNHCDKFLLTPYGTTSKYVSHTFIDEDHLDIVTKNDNFEVVTHFILYKDCAGFSIYNTVKNISSIDRVLEYVSTFYLYGYGSTKERIDEGMYLHKAHNSWHTEAQWKRLDFLHEGIFNANHKVSMERYQINNTGSWSTKEFLPMVGIEDSNKQIMLLGQAENNGSWHIELGDNADQYYLSISGPEFIDNAWCKSLSPNETFDTVKASIVLGSDFESCIQEMTLLRRHLIPNSKDLADMPVIYNDFMHAMWADQDEAHILPLVDAASEAGADIFVIDAGWFFKNSTWPDYIGLWKEEPSLYPTGGLTGLFNYIRSKGMKVGIWIEIENMGIKCPLINELPKEFFFKLGGKPIIRNNRYCLNLANKECYKWALNVISEIIDKYQIDYLKNDYNLSSGAGNDDGYLSPGEGLLEHNRALIKLIKELHAKYPNLTIESCASGGLRMDYAMLSVCPIQSTSDQEEFYNYPFIASNIFTAVLPEQAGIWSYPVDCRNKNEIDDEAVITNMVNSSLGRMHLASKLFKLSPNQMELVKEAVALSKEYASFKKSALPIFPSGTSFFFDKYASAGLIKDKEILLALWSTSKDNETVSLDLSKYDIKEINVLYPTKVDTNYAYDKDSNILTYYPKKGYSARLFKVLLK